MTGPDLPPPYPQQPQQPQPGGVPAWQSQVPPAPQRRRGRLVLVAVVVLLGLVGGGILAWTQLRGDEGGVVYAGGSELRAPGAVGSDPERAWEAEVSGQPYVLDSGDGRVVLLEEEAVVALSLEDGSEEWETELGEVGIGPRFLVAPGEGFAIPDRDLERTRWISFDDGAVAWEVDGLVVAVDGETAVVRPEGSDELEVVDALTGEERWAFPQEQSYGVAIADDVLVTADVDGVTVRGYDVEDGAELWTTELDDVGRVVAADGVAAVVGGDGVTALRTSDGDEVWQSDAVDVTRVAPDRLAVLDDRGTLTLVDPEGEMASVELETTTPAIGAVSGGEVDGEWLVSAVGGQGQVLLDEDLDEVADAFAGFAGGGYYTRDRQDLSFHEGIGDDPAWTAAVPGARFLVDGGILTFDEDGDDDVLVLYR